MDRRSAAGSAAIRPRVLVAEDDEELGGLLGRVLSGADYDVTVVRDGHRALHLGLTETFDLVVLDRGLPTREGLDVLRGWRSHGMRVPTLVLSAYGTVDDRIGGLDAGAEDYLVKPFDLDELLARLRALSRRREGRAAVAVAVRWLLDPDALVAWPRAVQREGHEVPLSVRESALLALLASWPRRAFGRAELLDLVFEHAADLGTVDTYVSYCRRKLDRGVVETVRGVGYRCGRA